jgi:hypothetical protein
MRSFFGLISIGLSLASSTTASAALPPAAAARFGAAAIGATIRPDASRALALTQAAPSLVIFGGAMQIPWTGSGDALVRAPLCISSPTGRYRLTITSAGGGKLQGASPFAYGVRFHDGAGSTQQAQAAGPVIVFEGSSGEARSCLSASNASLDIVLPERSLSGSTAGSYFDQITLKVDTL